MKRMENERIAKRVYIGVCAGRIDRVPNARIKELCRVTKGIDKRIDESVL